MEAQIVEGEVHKVKLIQQVVKLLILLAIIISQIN